jgi:hydrogenase maturation protease
MTQSIILACGNPLRGDDGVALQIASCLQEGYTEPDIETYCVQQWTPELAESISKADLAIFVDASTSIPAGKMRLEEVYASAGHAGTTTHSLSPGELLVLARELYQRAPARAYLLTVGGESFEHGHQLSDVVRQAIPAACNEIRALLSGVSLPDAETSRRLRTRAAES